MKPKRILDHAASGARVETTEQFALLVEHTSDGFVALSREFRITFLNSAAEQMLRRDRGSLLGLRVTDVFPWMSGSESMQNFERCMLERINVRWETYARAASTWIHVHAYPTQAGIAFVVQDIGERKRSELALRASEERFRTLADLVPELIWMCDPEFRNVWCNQRWRDYTGQSIEDVQDMGWLRVVHPDDRAAVVRDLSIPRGEMLRAERRLRCVDGSYRWFLIRRQHVVDPGGPDDGRIVGSASDIQELRDALESERAGRATVEAMRAEADAARSAIERAHEELELKIQQRTAELAETNRALAEEIAERVKSEGVQRELSRLLARAREDEQRRTARDLHDQIGQTLTALTLAIKSARSSAGLSEEIAGRLGEVQRVAENLGRDIHELASRLRPAVLDDLGLDAALRQIVMDWQRRSGVVVDLQTSGTPADRWSVEVETVLYRVVQEALTNVARHARATHVSVVVESIDGQAIAIVEDNGVGFDLDRVDAERLGVAGMRERVRLLGGRFALESTPGVGTTVIARLPALSAPRRATPEEGA